MDSCWSRNCIAGHERLSCAVLAPAGCIGKVIETRQYSYRCCWNIVNEAAIDRDGSFSASGAKASSLGSFSVSYLTLFLYPIRIVKNAVIIKPSTLLRFHQALVKRKYQRLFSVKSRRKLGPKGLSSELIAAIVDMKKRNPRFGCPRIAEQIKLAFGTDINKDVVRRVLDHHYHPVGDYKYCTCACLTSLCWALNWHCAAWVSVSYVILEYGRPEAKIGQFSELLQSAAESFVSLR